jgi:hypothetical protein
MSAKLLALSGNASERQAGNTIYLKVWGAMHQIWFFFKTVEKQI